MNFDVTLEEQNTNFDVDFGETTIVEVENKHNPLEFALQVVYYGISFPEGYELTLDMPYIYSLEGTFRNTTGIKKVTLKGNKEGKALSFANAFDTSSIEIVDMTDFVIKVGNGDNVFYNAKLLREIKGVIDMRSCYSAQNTFYNCYALEDFRILPSSIAYGLEIPYSPLLSAETRQSIIESLLPIGGTLVLHPDVVAKFTEEQILEITNKNWVVQGVMSVESE